MIVPPSSLFLMPKMALQITAGSGTRPHRHTAAQIILALEDSLQVYLSSTGCWTECPAVLIPPNVTHHIAGPAPQSLMIWFDPATPEARAMRSRSPNQLSLLPEAEVARHLAISLSSDLQTCRDAKQLSTAATRALLPEAETIGPIDERIAVVLKTMRHPDWLDRTYPLRALAQTVNLSSERLRHLFRQELGVPLQKYWVGYRLLVAIRRLGESVSLTELAHDAGFTDLAHFSRAFRASFGLSPSLASEDSHLIQAAS